MKTKSIVVGIVSVLVIAAVSFMVIRTDAIRQDRAEMISLFSKLTDEIQNFHSNVSEISPSVIGKVALQNELVRLKKKAETAIDKLSKIQREVDKSDSIDSIPLREAVECGIKYVTACRDICNQQITISTLKVASGIRVLRILLKRFRNQDGSWAVDPA